MFDLLNPFYLYMSPDDNGNGGGSSDPNSEDSSQGGDNSQGIDWSKVDPNSIPESVLKNNKAYSDVLTETIQRRQTIKELREKLTDKPQNQEKSKDEPNQNQSQIPNELQQQLDSMKEIMQGLVQNAQNQQAQSIAALRQQAAVKFGIKSDAVRDRLQGNDATTIFADAEKVAKELGIQAPPDRTGKVGNPNIQRDKAVLNRVEAMIQGKRNPVDPYSPDLHAALGGGYVDPLEN